MRQPQQQTRRRGINRRTDRQTESELKPVKKHITSSLSVPFNQRTKRLTTVTNTHPALFLGERATRILSISLITFVLCLTHTPLSAKIDLPKYPQLNIFTVFAPPASFFFSPNCLIFVFRTALPATYDTTSRQRSRVPFKNALVTLLLSLLLLLLLLLFVVVAVVVVDARTSQRRSSSPPAPCGRSLPSCYPRTPARHKTPLPGRPRS